MLHDVRLEEGDDGAGLEGDDVAVHVVAEVVRRDLRKKTSPAAAKKRSKRRGATRFPHVAYISRYRDP